MANALQSDGPPSFNRNVFVFFHGKLYASKVLYVRRYEDIWRYYVKYEASKVDTWKKGDTWDEWVGHDRVLARTKANRLLIGERENEANASPKKTKIYRPQERVRYGTTGRWKDLIYAEKENIDTTLGTAMPVSLYTRMLEDRDISLHVGRIIRLPHPYPIDKIKRQYILRLKKNNRPTHLVEKMLNRLVDQFDLKVQTKILYDTEVDDFQQQRDNASLSPSLLYGIEHLLRLLAQLPNGTFRGIKKEMSAPIMADFLAYLKEREDVFFLPRVVENQ